MKVLHVCAELYPLVKTGGLADVCAALPAAQRSLGIDARVLLPGFAGVKAGVEPTGPALKLATRNAPPIVQALGPEVSIIPARLRGAGLPLWFINAPAWYERPGGPYLDEKDRPWPDNAERFALLGWVGAQLGLGGDPSWTPDVVHAHDWHAALAPVYLATTRRGPKSAGSVLTIHNLAFQGRFPGELWPRLGLPAALFGIEGLEFYGEVSFLKGGILFSDALTTVSPRYAQEILTPEQGFGLDGVLRRRAQALHGILNGVDYSVWNPATDAWLAQPYDLAQLDGKARNKAVLQRELGLAPRADAVLFGVVSRLTEQKGVDLIAPVLGDLVARGGQLAVLGHGDAAIERALEAACAAHPGQARLRDGYDEGLAHRIIAAADVILVPSRFEPCGLTQLYGMRYGALPLVRAVGGLADTVVDSSLEAIDDGRASGFVFHEATPAALDAAIRRAFALHRRGADWQRVQTHAMSLRFDWARAARQYGTLYDGIRSSSARLAS
ncbi:starch synthase [Tibeticola sediminis]|uniref:Glycogen synthase n=1 Tax=Tibeticola sediminis TaxID=1917811 RepID=A0A3N4U8W2_9BURK|nr:glycogen synthase GlgA [Tibeticola sediminis]RPE66902.1 starch synthase [Tibeticola sediminis]